MALSKITENGLTITDLTVADDLTVSDDLLLASDGAILNLQTSDTSVENGNILGAIHFQAPDESNGGDAIEIGINLAKKLGCRYIEFDTHRDPKEWELCTKKYGKIKIVSRQIRLDLNS